MRVTRLLIEDFRNYARAERTIASAVTALVGRNGAGKTNVLEAIHLIARGDSPRARDDTELVRWGANTARVSARVERIDDARTVDVVLFSPPAGERRRPRRYLLDGAGKRADEAIGELAVVSFFPEDVQLLAEAPSARRRYLDSMVAQVYRRHRSETREYQRILEQRNSLLRALRSDVRPSALESGSAGAGEAGPGRTKKTARAATVGEKIAEKAKAAGIEEVIFDRGGYRYHGRVKALADAARSNGLRF